MAISRIWTDSFDTARPNEYETRCAACGQTVTAKLGRLVSVPTPLGEARSGSNKGIHKQCVLPPQYQYRAVFGSTTAKTMEQLGYAWDNGLNRWRKEGDTGEGAGNMEAADTTTPAPEPAREPTEAELLAAAKQIVTDVTDNFLKAVPDLVRATMHEATRTVEIKVPAKPKPVKVDKAHKILPDIVMAVAAKTNPFIVGPAGSGKTTLCMQVAEILSMKFYMANSVAGKHELLGFRDAHGNPVHTDFYKCFKGGGLFLFDEADNSNPNAMVALNSAIANGYCEFAGELVKAHKDFQVIASANTFGRGADALYVGRNKLDAATLDRYQTYIMDYDEELELELAGNDEWTKYVQRVRSVIFAEKIQHVVSPRASIAGARLLAAGMERSKVEEACVWKGLDNNHRVRITNRLGVGA